MNLQISKKIYSSNIKNIVLQHRQQLTLTEPAGVMLTSCYYSGPPLFISSDRSYLRYTELFNSLRHKLKVSDTDTASISFLVLHTASMQSNVVNNARNYNPHICCIEVRRIFEHNQLVCGAHNSSVVCSKCSKTQLDAMRVLLSFQS